MSPPPPNKKITLACLACLCFYQLWLHIIRSVVCLFRSVVVTCYSTVVWLFSISSGCMLFDQLCVFFDQLWLHIIRSVVWRFSISCGCMLFDLLAQDSLRAVVCQLNQSDQQGLRGARKKRKRKNQYHKASSRHNLQLPVDFQREFWSWKSFLIHLEFQQKILASWQLDYIHCVHHEDVQEDLPTHGNPDNTFDFHIH